MHVNNLPKLHSTARRLGFEPVTYWSQVRHPNHMATEPLVDGENSCRTWLYSGLYCKPSSQIASLIATCWKCCDFCHWHYKCEWNRLTYSLSVSENGVMFNLGWCYSPDGPVNNCDFIIHWTVTVHTHLTKTLFARWHRNMTLNPKPESKNNICSKRWHRNKVAYSVIFKSYFPRDGGRFITGL